MGSLGYLPYKPQSRSTCSGILWLARESGSFECSNKNSEQTGLEFNSPWKSKCASLYFEICALEPISTSPNAHVQEYSSWRERVDHSTAFCPSMTLFLAERARWSITLDFSFIQPWTVRLWPFVRVDLPLTPLQFNAPPSPLKDKIKFCLQHCSISIKKVGHTGCFCCVTEDSLDYLELGVFVLQLDRDTCTLDNCDNCIMSHCLFCPASHMAE